MRIFTGFLVLSLAALLGQACGSDKSSTNPGDGESTGSGGSGGGGGGSGGSGEAGGGSGGTSASGGSGGSGGNGGSTTATVTGTVQVVEGDTKTPIEGATVAVYGSSISTVSDASGNFTLEKVPSGEVFLSAVADGYWGTLDFYSVPDETSAGIELGLGTEADIADLGAALDREIDETQGVIDVVWDGASGGETAKLDVDADAPFTFDADGYPVAQETVIADANGAADQVFTGINPDDSPVTVTIAGADGETDCYLDASPGTTFPVIAKSISFAYAYCEPAR